MGKVMNPVHLIGWSFVGLCWWICLFTFGVFQTLMWSLIVLAACGIYLNLSEKKA